MEAFPKNVEIDEGRDRANWSAKHFKRNIFIGICCSAALLAIIGIEQESSNPVFSSRRSETCTAPSVDQSVIDVVNRTRRFGTGRPTCDQVGNATNAQRVAQIIGGEEGWDYLFPLRHGAGQFNGAQPFTYINFLTAVTQWPEFCGDNIGPYYPDDTPEDACKRELATLFANIAQETGSKIPGNNIEDWREGFYFMSEVGCTNFNGNCKYGSCSGWQGEAWPCDPTKGYFGRGAYQLSWNYNYGRFSKAMFGDVSVLLEDPDLVIDEGWLAFATAIWFFMTPQSPKPSGHDVAYGHYIPNRADRNGGRLPGFGTQIMILNGGLECGPNARYPDKAAARVRYFEGFAGHFGIDPGSSRTCRTMAAFDGASSAVLSAYWERSSSCECARTSDQTGDSLFDFPDDIDRSFCRCVGRHFGSGQCAGGTDSTSEHFEERTDGDQSCFEEEDDGGDEDGDGGGGGGDENAPPGRCAASCQSCVRDPDAHQSGVTDATCAPCSGSNPQTWWPCDVEGLCTCADAPPQPEPTTAPLEEPQESSRTTTPSPTSSRADDHTTARGEVLVTTTTEAATDPTTEVAPSTEPSPRTTEALPEPATTELAPTTQAVAVPTTESESVPTTESESVPTTTPTPPTPPTPPKPPAECTINNWQRCGGEDGCCKPSGSGTEFTCYEQDQWYAQCLPTGSCPPGWTCNVLGAAVEDEAPTTSQQLTTSTLLPSTSSSLAPSTSSEAPTTTSEAPTTTSEAPTTSSEAPTTSSEAPTTTSEAPTTTSEAPTTTSEAPTTSSQAPTTSTIVETTTPAPVVQPICPNPEPLLGLASGCNLWVSKALNVAASSHVEGKLCVGGNFKAWNQPGPGFSLGTALQDEAQCTEGEYSLVAAKNVRWRRGVKAQRAHCIGGEEINPKAGGPLDSDCPGDRTQDALQCTDVIDFASDDDRLRALSDKLQSRPLGFQQSTATMDTTAGVVLISLDARFGLQVVSLDAGFFEDFQAWGLRIVAEQGSLEDIQLVVINLESVSAEGVVLSKTFDFPREFGAKVLFNYAGSAPVSVGGNADIYGSLLAPRAVLASTSQGTFHGQVVVKTYKAEQTGAVASFNHLPLSTAPVCVEEGDPANLAVSSQETAVEAEAAHAEPAGLPVLGWVSLGLGALVLVLASAIVALRPRSTTLEATDIAKVRAMHIDRYGEEAKALEVTKIADEPTAAVYFEGAPRRTGSASSMV